MMIGLDAIDLIGAFRRRCEGWAAMYGAGQLDLHDAVDRLQGIAGPLIDLIGQDAVQAIMAETFRPYRENEPESPAILPPAAPVYDDYGLGQGWDSPMPDPAPREPAPAAPEPQDEPVELTAEELVMFEKYHRREEGKRARKLKLIKALKPQAPPAPAVPQSTLDAADYVRSRGDKEALRKWLDAHREYLPGILEHWRNG